LSSRYNVTALFALQQQEPVLKEITKENMEMLVFYVTSRQSLTEEEKALPGAATALGTENLTQFLVGTDTNYSLHLETVALNCIAKSLQCIQNNTLQNKLDEKAFWESYDSCNVFQDVMGILKKEKEFNLQYGNSAFDAILKAKMSHFQMLQDKTNAAGAEFYRIAEQMKDIISNTFLTFSKQLVGELYISKWAKSEECSQDELNAFVQETLQRANES